MSIEEKAAQYHAQGFNCAQSVLAACGEYTGLDEKSALAIAGGLGAHYLVMLSRGSGEDDTRMRQTDYLTYRLICLGFLLLTVVILSGAIWAEQAWSLWWSWDPKETWALITWFIYAIYLHLRLSRGWRDRRAALFAVIGFVCVIFTYIGVNTLLPGIHSYA